MNGEQTYFRLKEDFIKEYKGKQPKWGPLGYITYKRTYAREKNDGTTEEYWETCKRVVEGVFTVQKRHCEKNLLPWDQKRSNRSAETMFTLMWQFKFTPSGRGLWMMGTDYMYKQGSAALQNCAFVSTKDIEVDFAEPFCFLMDMSMLGVGVGADTKGANKLRMREPKSDDNPHVVPDTREGWVNLIRRVLKSYVGEDTYPTNIDYSQVRKFGEKIRGFGGVASGPEPLNDLVVNISNLLDSRIGKTLQSTDLVDIFNYIGVCVVAGNVRRTAEIMFGEIGDKEFAEMKDPEKNKKELMSHRWASNNSLFAEVGMDYDYYSKGTAKNGEVGYVWMSNAKDYGRMCEPPNFKDYRAAGTNPCVEQTLESYELCNLVETFPVKHDSLEDWLETLKYAYLYAKTVTLIPTHNHKTNSVMMRNRRIGCSISGITQAFKKFGRRQFFEYCDKGYEVITDWDKVYSDWLCIPRSIKTTSIKPSGTVSLLSGVTSGVHYPISPYYIRNIRFSKDSNLLPALKEAGYTVEDDKYSETSVVVSFPIKEDYFDRSVDEVSMWEQLENVASLQRFWADNQVSCTITFTKEEGKQIKYALELYESQLKGVSFLPLTEHGYEQAPYIPITKEEFVKSVKALKKLKHKKFEHEETEKFCDACQFDLSKLEEE